MKIAVDFFIRISVYTIFILLRIFY